MSVWSASLCADEPASCLQVVPIMSNVTWSDVGAIVVWCVEFHVNFGYIVLPTNMGMGMAPGEHTLPLPLGRLPSPSPLAGSVTSRACMTQANVDAYHQQEQPCCAGECSLHVVLY